MSRLLVIIAALGCLIAAAQPIKSTRTVVIHVDGYVTPASFSELCSAASAVIVGTVASSAAADLHDGTVIRNQYSINTDRVLKRDAHVNVVGNVIHVLQTGGQRDEGTYIVEYVEAGFKNLSIGGQYLLFLHWNDTYNTYEPYDGPEGTYESLDGIVSPLGTSVLAKAQKGKPLDQLAAEVFAKCK
jgi:hypothetical protein